VFGRPAPRRNGFALALALVGDADANAYELLVLFCNAFESTEQFLHLVRTNEGMVNDYIVEKKGGPRGEGRPRFSAGLDART
jgi:hypothetical protein